LWRNELGEVHAKLSDFGTARSISPNHVMTCVGTPCCNTPFLFISFIDILPFPFFFFPKMSLRSSWRNNCRQTGRVQRKGGHFRFPGATLFFLAFGQHAFLGGNGPSHRSPFALLSRKYQPKKSGRRATAIGRG